MRVTPYTLSKIYSAPVNSENVDWHAKANSKHKVINIVSIDVASTYISNGGSHGHIQNVTFLGGDHHNSVFHEKSLAEVCERIIGHIKHGETDADMERFKVRTAIHVLFTLPKDDRNVYYMYRIRSGFKPTLMFVNRHDNTEPLKISVLYKNRKSLHAYLYFLAIYTNDFNLDFDDFKLFIDMWKQSELGDY